MSAVAQVTKTGPRTYVPAEVIVGGQLIEARGIVNGSGRVGVAAAGSLKVLGVALTDAQPPEAFSSTPAIVGGRSVLNAAILPQVVPVAYAGDEVKVVYSAPAAFGDKLVSTGAGKVGPAGATPDARTIVGTCTQPEGVTAANAAGLMRIV